MFAQWALQCAQFVVIDFYDLNERASEWKYEVQGRHVHCEWIQEEVTLDTLKGMDYDIVIDDVWTYEEGPSISGLHKYLEQTKKEYSIKGTEKVKDGFTPFLHSVETRFHTQRKQRPVLREQSKEACQCMVCRTCYEIGMDYPSYVFLRHMCTRLGHVGDCLVSVPTQELQMVYEVMRAVTMQPYFQVTRAHHLRALMVVSQEIGLSYDRGQATIGQYETALTLERRGDNVVLDRPQCDFLKGKRVIFAGVPATVLLGTEIQTVKGTQSSNLVDAVFCNTLQSWRTHTEARAVFFPGEIGAEMPNWTKTSRSWRGYNEYVYVPQVKKVFELPVMQKNGHLVSSVPCSLVPHLDVTSHGSFLDQFPVRMKVREGVQLYSIAYVSETLSYKLEKFDVARWRQSVWARGKEWGYVVADPAVMMTDATYILASRNVKLFFNCGFRVPWNMTYQELEMVAKTYNRGLSEKMRDLVGKIPSSELIIDGVPWKVLFKTQNEFKIDSRGRVERIGPQHPGWLEDRGNWVYRIRTTSFYDYGD